MTDSFLIRKTEEKNRLKQLAKHILSAESPVLSKERRRTLMISEQDNFMQLIKQTPANFPKKKFKAVVPHEYSKFVLNMGRVSLNQDYTAKYIYPRDVLTNSQIDQLKCLQSNIFIQVKSECYKSAQSRLKSFIYHKE